MKRLALVAVVVVASTACGTRTSLELLERPAVDAGSTVDAPVPPPCVGGVIAGAVADPWFIAVDDVSIYWLDQGSASVSDDSRIGRCPKAGACGTPEVLWSPIAGGGGLALDDSAVYWTDLGSGEVASCDKLICTPRTLFTDSSDAPITLGVDGPNLDVISYHSIETCGVGGCASPTKLTALTYGALAIASDSSAIYYTTASPNGAPRGSVYACTKPACDGGPRVVADALPAAPWGIVVDDTDVYFTIGGAAADADGAGEVRVCPKSGCGASPVSLVTGRDHPTAIVADSDHVYWVEQGSAARAFRDGVVASCPKSGCAGAPSVVASALYLPTSIAVDDRCVYWATSGDTASPGAIARAPK